MFVYMYVCIYIYMFEIYFKCLIATKICNTLKFCSRSFSLIGTVGNPEGEQPDSLVILHRQETSLSIFPGAQ